MAHRIAAIAALAAAVLGIATASASAVTTKPPTIKEPFTPLKCTHAGTTLAEEACAEKPILKTDKQIDALNAQIFQKLNATARKDFLAGHNAWFKYRQAYCASESDIDQGGTEAPVVEAQCEAKVNTAHVTELKGFLASLSRA